MPSAAHGEAVKLPPNRCLPKISAPVTGSKAGHQTSRIENVQLVVIKQGRRVIAAGRPMPGDKLVARFSAVQRNIAARARPHGKQRPRLAEFVTRIENQQIAGGNRCRYADRRHGANSQSNFPSKSYERTLLVAHVTISVRRLFSQTKGVAQLLFSSRRILQIKSPVRLSSAVMNDSCSLSLTR